MNEDRRVPYNTATIYNIKILKIHWLTMSILVEITKFPHPLFFWCDIHFYLTNSSWQLSYSV